MTETPALSQLLRRAVAALDIVLGLLLVVFVSRAIKNAPINVDAGYYLPVAERMYDGFVPVRDLQIHYAPLGMYLLMIAKTIGGGTHAYSFFLGFVILVQMACAGLVYAILGRVTARVELRIMGALTTLAQLFYYDGTFILLEPFVLIFSLAAVLVCLREHPKWFHWVLAGAFGCLAFWCKQYGVLLFPALLYAAFAQGPTTRARVINLAMVSAGALGVHALVVLYFVAHEVTPIALWKMLVWSDQSYGINSLSKMLVEVGFQYVIKTSAFILLVPLLVFSPRFRRDTTLHVFLLAFLGYCVPLYVRQFAHYYMLIVPFGVLVLIQTLVYAESWASTLPPRRAALALASFVFLLIMPIHVVRMIGWMKTNKREELETTAAQLARSIPSKSRVFLYGHAGLTFLDGWMPASMSKAGYMWSGWWPRDELTDILDTSMYVVVDRQKGTNIAVRGGALELTELRERGFCSVESGAPSFDILVNSKVVTTASCATPMPVTP